MAKAKAKAKKQKKQTAEKPLVAVFNFDRETERGAALYTLLSNIGFMVRTVSPEHINDQVGYIAGMPRYRSAPMPYTGAVPGQEFMLLCNLSEAQQKTLLDALREANIVISCKAVVTKVNKDWPFALLLREVAKEEATYRALSQGLDELQSAEGAESEESEIIETTAEVVESAAAVEVSAAAAADGPEGIAAE